MSTCSWMIIPCVGIGIVIVAIIAFVLFPNLWYEYWKERYLVRPSWRDGIILGAVRFLFWFLSRLSIGRIIVIFKENKYEKQKIKYELGRRMIYQFVDWYVMSWMGVLAIITIFVNILNIRPPFTCIILGLVSYLLFDIWQSWVSQFVLGGIFGQWYPRNLYRSLLLVFLTYVEIVFSFALLYFILMNHFEGIICWQQAFYYSIRNAITIGSSDVNPISGIGFTILATQVMFILLFLTSAINTIITRTAES